MGGAVISKVYVIVGLVLGVLMLTGSVSGASPPTNVSSCQTIDLPGEYVLNKSISNLTNDCITIESSDVTFDGAGYNITGSGSNNGIYVYNSSTLTNVTVRNVTATNWSTGIYYRNAENGSIENNNASNTWYGIWLDSSSSNTLTNNNVSSNTNTGIYLDSSSNYNNLTNNNVSSNGNTGIVLDSSSYNTLTNNNVSSNTQSGIRLDSSSNYNTLTNNTASSNTAWAGIYLATSSNNTLTNNTANSNSRGIYLSDSSSNTLTNNNANSNSQYGISLIGGEGGSNYNTLTNNNANSNSQYGIYLLSASNNTLTDNNASNNNVGIRLYSSSNNTITNNTANSNNWYGIYLDSSSNNTLTNNNASNNDEGIYLDSASNNTLTNNNASSNSNTGIYLDSSSSNILKGNTINLNNWNGIWLGFSSNNNTITNNTASNSDTGIFLDYSGSNLIYNNLFNNTNNAFDDGNNRWNTTKQTGTNIINGSYLGGNFWAKPDGTGFSETCAEADGDMICDSGLNITGGSNVDYLPLTGIPTRWTLPDVAVPSIPGDITDSCGGVNFTDSGVQRAMVDRMGVTGYGCFATTNGTTPAVNISVTVFTEPPSGVNSSGADDVPGFYYQISVNDSSWFDNVTMVQLRLYYNISTITLPSGVSESSLRASRYTNGSWVRLDCSALGGCTVTLPDNRTKLFAAGVVTSSQSPTPYVWANLSNFSVYGVSGAIIAASTGSSGGVYTPEVIVLANSIDASLTSDFFGFLRSKRINVIHASARDFSQYKDNKRFIIILGGPDAYDGVGDIVEEVLNGTEQERLRADGNTGMYVKTDVWRTDTRGQMVWVIAGSNRELTGQEATDNQAEVADSIKYYPTV